MKSMLLKELLALHLAFFKSYEEIIIFIPQDYQSAEITIKDIFLSQIIEPNFKLLASKPNSRYSYFNLFKIYTKTIGSFIKLKKPELTKKQNPFTFLLGGNPNEYTKGFFNNYLTFLISFFISNIIGLLIGYLNETILTPKAK
jgi:hypothetical protein